MTTPERLRRRQLIEGGALVLIGIAMFFQSLYFNNQDTEQRKELAAQNQCLTDFIQADNAVTQVRSALGAQDRALDEREALLDDREAAASNRIWLVYGKAAGLLRDDPTAELSPEDQDRIRRESVAALLNYVSEARKIEKAREEITRDRKEIEQEREENPIPPLPDGECE